MPGLTIALLTFAAIGLLLWRRSKRPLVPESLFKVAVDAREICCTEPNGRQHKVAWPDVASIRIHTNDSGPWGTDVIWGFHDSSGSMSVAVPGGATGESEMLAELSRLPGWRHEEVIAAMGCTSNREFLCWQKSWRESAPT